jgi:hypothetical protein
MRHFLTSPQGTGRLSDHHDSTMRPGRPIDIGGKLLDAGALVRRTPPPGPRELGTDRRVPYSSRKIHSPGHSSEASVTASSSPEGT